MQNPIPKSGLWADLRLEEIQTNIEGLPKAQKALVYSYVMATLNACHNLVEEAMKETA